MWSNNFLFIFACSLQLSAVLALWSCSEDDDCSSLAGSVCRSGSCACPHGHQSVLGGSLCATVAPYHTSACVESHQCSRLFTSFECRRSGNERDGKCFCQEDHHYFRGRCWPIAEYGATCTRHEECLSVMRDPFSLRCDGTCVCATGYYSRQRGECRKIAAAVGEGCVLDEDCQFPGGACNVNTFRCYDVNAPPTEPPPAPPVTEPITEPTTAEPGDRPTTEEPEIIVVEGQFCDLNNPCPSPYQCSKFSSCVCPVGYYGNEAGTLCLAELGSPSTSEQCVGLLAEVRDGVCTCPANFFFDENMRDCVKVTRRITDSCVSDMNCFTFGSAARCGPPQQPWQLRSCECIPELAVWDADRNICRFFAGIGETCEVDSDCLAGELEIQCVKDEAGQGYCTCPEDLIAVDGLCVTSGLVLGEACQVSLECSGTENAVCTDGVCSCNTGYQQVDDFCAPVIGGTCSVDSDCRSGRTRRVTVRALGAERCRALPRLVLCHRTAGPPAALLHTPAWETGACCGTPASRRLPHYIQEVRRAVRRRRCGTCFRSSARPGPSPLRCSIAARRARAEPAPPPPPPPPPPAPAPCCPATRPPACCGDGTPCPKPS